MPVKKRENPEDAKPLIVDPINTVAFLRNARTGVSQPVQEDLGTLADLIEKKKI